MYSVLFIKQTGGKNRTGWAEFFHLLLHEKRVQGGARNIILLHEK